MKKLPIVLLAILMVFSLFSCAEPEVAPPKEYTVSFEGITKDPVKVKEGEKFILPAEMPSNEGYKLIVKMGETVLETGKEYEITADTVLKCSWEKIAPEGNISGKRTISFDIKDKDGNAIARDPETVDDGAEFTVPEDIRNGITVPDGSAFVIRHNGKQLYPGNKITVTSDITLICSVKEGSPSLLYTDPDADNNVAVKKYADNDHKYTGDIIIPETKNGNQVTGIGNHAFYGCENLTSITIPESITSIYKNAFSNSGLTEIHIPAKAEFEKGSNPFDYCNKLKTITVDNSNKTLRSQGNCILSKNGKTLITCASDAVIPAEVTEIGEYACSGMAFSSGTITIPDGVTTIGLGAFEGCTSLTSITIPKSVTSIGNWVFNICTSLTSITIPDSVTSIGTNAFNNTPKLNTINVCKPANECTGWGNNWNGGHEVTYNYTPVTP